MRTMDKQSVSKKYFLPPKVNAFYKRIGGIKVRSELPSLSVVTETKEKSSREPLVLFNSYEYKENNDSSVKVIRL